MGQGILRRVAVLALLLGAALVGPEPALAQTTRADSAAVLLDAAAEFATEGRDEVAEALYRLILRRFADTPAAETARLRVGALAPLRRSSGETELQVWSTLYGAWLGVAVPGAFGADGPEPYGLGLLLGAPTGFVVSRVVARRTDLTIGQARAITLGGTWGTWQGFGWREVLDLGEDFADGGSTDEETFAAMVLGGVAGVATGAYLSRHAVSDAVATGANLGALWGSWFGVALGVLADLEDDDLLAATLVGGNAGLAGAGLATPALGWSRNRWRVVSIGGLLGGVAGAGLDLLFQVDDEKAAVATPLLTSILGLAVGAAVTRDDDGPASPEAAFTGALVSRTDGEWTVGTPAPALRMLPVETPAGARWRTTLGVTLLRASF